MKMILIISIMLVILAGAASDHEGNNLCADHPTGMLFGQHVAEHARAGELGMEHYPGMHQGFSPCAKELHMPGV